MKTLIYSSKLASVCYFRSVVRQPNYKVLLQITERCNLSCFHCFVNSSVSGEELSFESITDRIIPNLIKSRVVNVTLTGGEPLLHINALEIISALCDSGIAVSICTNGSLITEDLLCFAKERRNIFFNISLDGLMWKSHGRFRGITDESVFSQILRNIESAGKLNLLKGILTTPNRLATIDEYDKLCEFAKNAGANYILMNPLSPFNRGIGAQHLALSNEEMILLKNKTRRHISDGFDVVYIRFPNNEYLQLGKCSLGSFPYVFSNGDVVICPYMVFAAHSGDNFYKPEQFILYNVLRDDSTLPESIERFTLPGGSKAYDTTLAERGCCAMKIVANKSLDDNYEVL